MLNNSYFITEGFMHKKFYIRLIVSILFIFFICVLYNPSKQEVLKITDTQTISKLFCDKKNFFIKFTKKGCVYCEKVEELDFDNNPLFYEYSFKENSSIKDVQQLKNFFPTLEAVPIFYYVSNGKIIDELLITDWNNPKKEITEWMRKYQ